MLRALQSLLPTKICVERLEQLMHNRKLCPAFRRFSSYYYCGHVRGVLMSPVGILKSVMSRFEELGMCLSVFHAIIARINQDCGLLHEFGSKTIYYETRHVEMVK